MNAREQRRSLSLRKPVLFDTFYIYVYYRYDYYSHFSDRRSDCDTRHEGMNEIRRLTAARVNWRNAHCDNPIRRLAHSIIIL